MADRRNRSSSANRKSSARREGEGTAAPTSEPYDAIAPFYDRTFAGFDADLPLYVAFARRLDAPVLELGAGTGRVAIALAQAGHTVIGLDRSAGMLHLARAALARRRIDRVWLLRGEMARPPLRGAFGLICCARDSFLHLADSESQLAALCAAREMLHPEGRIVLDLPGPAGDWGDWAPGARPVVLDWSEAGPQGRLSRFTTFRADAAAQKRTITDIFERIAQDGTVRRTVVEYTLRFIFPAELHLLLGGAGLRLAGLYGGYELEPFAAESERMIAVAARDDADG
ncbi:MAG TPA: class I SAM-dependent methyltransferase [Dehalococcoidia bacterium]|nr:class I SAM-dependent methyltransferase [Dehalococcoidia bacterium]